jgi:hypothetical protein
MLWITQRLQGRQTSDWRNVAPPERAEARRQTIRRRQELKAPAQRLNVGA